MYFRKVIFFILVFLTFACKGENKQELANQQESFVAGCPVIDPETPNRPVPILVPLQVFYEGHLFTSYRGEVFMNGKKSKYAFWRHDQNGCPYRICDYLKAMSKINKKVYVAMSGGVDSSVAALLLKEQGYEVTGVFMRNWHAEIHGPFLGDCPWQQDWADVEAVCEKLGIPARLWDFSQAYHDEVVSYFFREYEAGRTPNPDVMCNKHIKFGKFLEKALGEGADFIATGHYVRLRQQETRNPVNPDKSGHGAGKKQETKKFQISNFKFQNNYSLLKGVDPNKDQSYFLWTLTQTQLKYVLFPIGEYTKPEVRQMAKEAGLPTHNKKDSQGICFIGKINVQDFLRSRLPEKVGAIVTLDGQSIGQHSGAYFYTEGQRQGLKVGGQIVPHYVMRKDVETNTVTMVPAYDQRLYSSRLTVSDVNWIAGFKPKLPLSCQARIRYRQGLESCLVEPAVSNLTVKFTNPQRAVSRGQSIVFYQDEVCLGGGIIE